MPRLSLLLLLLPCIVSFASKHMAPIKSAPYQIAKNYVEPYGKQLCYTPGFHCALVKPAQTWRKLWPNFQHMNIMMRLNRSNVALKYRAWVIIPNHLSKLTVADISPFPKTIHTPGKKVIVVDLGLQAYGAYNADGHLVFWGPATNGQNWCPDVNRECRTLTGVFRIFRKQGADCRSSTFPVGQGGTPMPYCMFWHNGYALHGAEVPGFPSTHGCVGVYNNDARWLNTNFVTANAKSGTLIMIGRW